MAEDTHQLASQGLPAAISGLIIIRSTAGRTSYSDAEAGRKVNAVAGGNTSLAHCWHS